MEIISLCRGWSAPSPVLPAVRTHWGYFYPRFLKSCSGSAEEHQTSFPPGKNLPQGTGIYGQPLRGARRILGTRLRVPAARQRGEKSVPPRRAVEKQLLTGEGSASPAGARAGSVRGQGVTSGNVGTLPSHGRARRAPPLVRLLALERCLAGRRKILGSQQQTGAHLTPQPLCWV